MSRPFLVSVRLRGLKYYDLCGFAARAIATRSRRHWQAVFHTEFLQQVRVNLTIRLIVQALFAAFLCHPGSLAAEEFFPVDAVRRGMRGYGLTVFQGTAIDTFGFEVLGVERGRQPQQDTVWGLMSGGPLAESGPVAGMSGSPVYLEGKLLGAVAHGFSAVKKPYAGVTPIRNMLEVLDRVGDGEASDAGAFESNIRERPPRPTDVAGAAEGLKIEGLKIEDLRIEDLDSVGSLEWMRNELPALGARRRSVRIPVAGIVLEPLATPLMVSGMGSETFALISPVLSEMGFMPLEARGTSSGLKASPVLEPGAMVGVQLVRGDWNVLSYGTVTHRQGDRIVAFGHPMFSTGQIEWPMITVDVHFVVANLLRSFKLCSAIETIGTVTQDRAAGVAGIVGPSPSMIPVTIAIDGLEPRDFRYEVVRDKGWTSAATLFSIIGSISSAGKRSGDHTVRLNAQVGIAGERVVREQNLFSGPAAPFQAAAAVSRIVSVLLNNRFGAAHVDKIDIQLALEERNSEAVIEGVRVLKKATKPGGRIDIAVLVRPISGELNGEIIRHMVSLEIPQSTPEGQLELRVADARSAHASRYKRAPGIGRPRDMSQLLDALETSPGNNQITVDLLLRRPGVTVGATEMASVPGSMLSVMRSSRHSGETMFTQGTVVSTQTLATDYVVKGHWQLPITVDRRAR